jgi:uncharacterized protein
VPVISPGPVAGSTALPAGFAHPHASEEARSIAERGMILRVQVGSGVHGTSIAGQDDRDEMGLCLEPPQFVTGLARVPFEQYERHTAWDRPGGVANRSGAGDLDVIIYSARKWARLALAGNPTVLLVLFVPDEEVVFRDEAGAELAANASRFVSRLAAGRYLGYLRGQRAAMTGQPGARTNRPELVAVHGYDTKYAMHALRLGLQGTELLTTGRITLPVPEPDRAYLRSIRRGERPLAEVLDAITGAEERLARLRDSPAIPGQPDRQWVDDWLHRSYLDFWTRTQRPLPMAGCEPDRRPEAAKCGRGTGRLRHHLDGLPGGGRGGGDRRGNGSIAGDLLPRKSRQHLYRPEERLPVGGWEPGEHTVLVGLDGSLCRRPDPPAGRGDRE